MVEHLPNNHKFEGMNPAFAETGERNQEKIKTIFKTSAGSTVEEQMPHIHKLEGLNLAIASNVGEIEENFSSGVLLAQW